jgi:hypothetical protein
MGQATRVWHLRRFPRQPKRCSMSQPNDSNKSVTPLEKDTTMIAVIEMGQASWLVAGIVPGLERQPLKKLGSDEQALFQLLQRWRAEAVQAGRTIKRLVVAYEAGRDGFWLARWLRARDIETYVIHPNSVAVSREHRRAKPSVRRHAQLQASTEGKSLPEVRVQRQTFALRHPFARRTMIPHQTTHRFATGR